MGANSRPGGRNVPPYLVDGTATGTEVTMDAGRRLYTLAANSTYVFLVGGRVAPFLSITFTGYTAGMIITSATVQDTDHATDDVGNATTVTGEWISEIPSTAYVGAGGTGWTVTNGVVAAAGTGVGGARWNVAETAADRTRLLVVVGATGGVVRCSAGGKT